MNLAETFVPLLPLTLTGSITLKSDHPRRVWELDETYHAAQQTSFRETNMAAKQNYVPVFCRFHFGAGTILKMTVATNGEDGITRPY